MNAGTPPEPGKSRMITETYRVTLDGRRVTQSRRRTIKATPDPEWVADSLAWPCPVATPDQPSVTLRGNRKVAQSARGERRDHRPGALSHNRRGPERSARHTATAAPVAPVRPYDIPEVRWIRALLCQSHSAELIEFGQHLTEVLRTPWGYGDD